MPAAIINGRIVITSELVQLTGTDPVRLYQCMPPGMKFVLRKLEIYNKDSADHEVIIGEYDATGGSWVRDIHVIKVASGQSLLLSEDQLPRDFVVTVDPATAIKEWRAKLDAATSASPVYIKAEFEVV